MYDYMKIENTDKEKMDTVVLVYRDDRSLGVFFFLEFQKRQEPVIIFWFSKCYHSFHIYCNLQDD